MHPDGQLFWWLAHGVEAPEGRHGHARLRQNPLRRRPLVPHRLHPRQQRRPLRASWRARWTMLLHAPDFALVCDGKPQKLSDLRGSLVRILFGAARALALGPSKTVFVGATPPADAKTCHAEDSGIVAAYQIVTGAPPSAVLVDANGWLPPSGGQWGGARCEGVNRTDAGAGCYADEYEDVAWAGPTHSLPVWQLSEAGLVSGVSNRSSLSASSPKPDDPEQSQRFLAMAEEVGVEYDEVDFAAKGKVAGRHKAKENASPPGRAHNIRCRGSFVQSARQDVKVFWFFFSKKETAYFSTLNSSRSSVDRTAETRPGISADAFFQKMLDQNVVEVFSANPASSCASLRAFHSCGAGARGRRGRRRAGRA